MASRQNQGLQILLIIFVMTSILLGGLVYLFATNADEHYKKLVLEQEKVQTANKRLQASQQLSDLLMAWIGSTDLSEEQWRAQYDDLASKASDAQTAEFAEKAKKYYDFFQEDMFNFGADYTDPKGWRTLPTYLLTTIKQKNAAIETANVQRTQEAARYQAEVAAAQDAQAVAEEGRAAAVAEKAQVEQALRAVETQIRGEQADALVAATTAREEQQSDLQTLTATRDEYEDLADNRMESVQLLAAKVDEYEREEFDIADGEIVHINHNLGIVYINLGSADNLPRTQVFTVYGRDASTFNPTGKKGVIRILRIRDAHSAEAEIIEQDLSNPFAKEDKIFTPVWQPGRTLKFALTGFIDFDGNGRFEAIDIQSLSTIIADNGGEVIAHIDPETGDMVGDIDALTQFVVTGDEPLPGGDPVVTKSIVDNTRRMRDMATEASVEMINYHELLERYGYRSEQGIERTGPGVENSFQPRRPPARTNPGSSF
ncbi:MAG: hypothetical protein R3B96_01265 [Pirellulaceae bacterium]|nr:hypothetical protein [Planctomycetales bacterium]